jgi:diketogulonate reductase-like aldo/keto reductase
MRMTSIAGDPVPVLGQGTWQLGDRPERRRQEIAALQLGIDLGLTLIDTAELYGDGASEELVAEAIAGRREKIFLVTKVLPSNASTRRKIVASCEASLRRLRVEHIDLYLLHWRHGEKLPVLVETFSELVKAGKIRHWGVSNFDGADMQELAELPGGKHVASNQVLYNLSRRGIEWDLLPWCRQRGMPVMAYSPIEQGRLPTSGVLAEIGQHHGCSPFQVALAWVLHQEGVIAIPKAARPQHVTANVRALDLMLTREDLAALDRCFPPPGGRQPLEML